MNQIILEPELEAKTLDAWSWIQNRSLKFHFRLHSLLQSIVAYDTQNAFAKRNIFFVL